MSTEEAPEAFADRLRRSPVRLAFDAGSELPRLLEGIADTVEKRGACVVEQARALLGGLGIVPPRATQLRATSKSDDWSSTGPDWEPAPPPAPATSTAAERAVPPTESTGAAAPSEQRSTDAFAPGSAFAVSEPAAVADAVEGEPSGGDLPIPSYDSLSASQVVPRLASLEPDELDRIREYESAGRARRTILNRIDQLRSA